MFDTFARLLSSIPTFLFPLFASYKALKTSDPALLTPWLMYWVVLAIALFAESWLGFILVWIPFYSWLRLGFPSLSHPSSNSRRKGSLRDISSAHERAKAAGVTYLKQAIELIRQQVFGLPPKEPTPPPTPFSLYLHAKSHGAFQSTIGETFVPLKFYWGRN
ncbi:hypothetical protein EYC84_007033 [Monilinia fructicola]|uniref:Protein YOP1 n=1 Tax=Monilinia fructicola TaxID=38448 RepID=A0A5M9K5A9_MONFR|nr:hypothetical protein EYC84_007033 [Monilinia fructicola]